MDITHPRRPTVHLIGTLIAFKVVCFLLIFIAVGLMPRLFSKTVYYGNFHRGELTDSIERYFETWDAQHYLHLSEVGYEDGSLSSAFYPLWPFLIRIFSPLTGGSTLLSALVLANAFSVLALVLLHASVTRQMGQRVADRTVALMLAFPGAIFFLFPYTESLFLLLSVWIWVLIHRARDTARPKTEWKTDVAMGVAAYLSALTRPTGAMWCLPLAVHFTRRRKWTALPLAGLPLLGFATYIALVYVLTGRPLEGMSIQGRFVAQNDILKVFDLAGFISALSRDLQVHGVVDSGLDRLWFVWLCASLPSVYKHDREAFFYALLMGVVPAMTASFVSYTRYVAIVFPMFLVTAKAFGTPRWTQAFTVLLALLFGIQVLLLTLHINFYWAG